MMAYGRADGNARGARRIYEERFPNRRLPSRNTFQNTYRRLHETGNVQNNETRGVVVRHNVRIDEQILRLFEEDGLEDNDFGNRVRLCRLLLHADVDDPDFLKSILWTDDSNFTKEGILNLHNLHRWSSKDDNPRVKRQMSFQRRFSLNVWAGDRKRERGQGQNRERDPKLDRSRNPIGRDWDRNHERLKNRNNNLDLSIATDKFKFLTKLFSVERNMRVFGQKRTLDIMIMLYLPSRAEIQLQEKHRNPTALRCRSLGGRRREKTKM
ncbi:hypothetical protein EVAR_43115_1 [Eumeta japonica]|uniref:DUF4817 domain-containing protein n=1 Tax=Eumeta variegata TaxID=151549 RepID=A0A4C1YIC1_EUMVA|nr:hypothetical protein EVAR_43115_1 [Eumeta japonica]